MGMSVPTDSTVERSASGNVTQSDGSHPAGSAAPETDILVFICYRRSDGQLQADWIDRALNDWQCTRSIGSKARVRTYFDRTAPAVPDWTKYHFPSLQTAHSLIVVCTPGAAKDLSTPGKPDWVYEEVRWWIANRSHPPIVVDVTAEGARWVPEPILRKWPDINRVPLRMSEAQTQSGTIDERYLARWREQVEHTLHESERATVFDNVAHFARLTKELRLRAKILTGALIAAAALAAISFWSFRVASSANDSSQALNRFLGGLFYQADPDQTQGASLTAGQMLDAGVLEARLSRNPSVQIEMLVAIGAAYTGLGEHEKAIALLKEAVELAKQHRISKQARFNLALAQGEALLYQDRFEEARDPLERALKSSQAGTDRSHSLVALGDLETWAPEGDRTLAREHYQQAVAIDREFKERLDEARDRNRLGYLANKEGNLAAAKEDFAAALSLVRAARETSGSLLVAKYGHDQAAVQYAEGDLPGARSNFEYARQQLVSVYGEKNGDVAIADNNLARVAIEQDDLAGVEDRLTRTAETLESEFGPDYSDLSFALNSLGLVRRERGDLAGARLSFGRAQEIAEANADHGIAAQTLIHLAETFMAEGNFAAASTELDRAMTHFPTADAQKGWRFGLYEGALAELKAATCELRAADDLLERSEAALKARWPWPNMFRRANEQRRSLLTTMQTNDTTRCRGASTHGQAKES